MNFSVSADLRHTVHGTPYLVSPGLILLSRPQVELGYGYPFMDEFLDGFEHSLGFEDYRRDEWFNPDPAEDLQADTLAKVAGQLCYLSFGPGRTKNVDMEVYFRNILASGHGSVLEHSNFTFLFYGVSRSFTHELVRHRAGFGFSQVSQRYVDGSKLRFVCRPEFADDPELHVRFQKRIDATAAEYEDLSNALSQTFQTRTDFQALSRTDRRKALNQVARSILPNETEAPIIVTANLRAWRHFFGMRGSVHAETEIRRVAVETFRLLKPFAPNTLQDIQEVPGPMGIPCLEMEWRKV